MRLRSTAKHGKPDGRKLFRTEVDAVIAALDTRFSHDEAAIAERMLREYASTMPDAQLIEEIGLAIAIHRRTHGPRTQRLAT